MRKAKRPKTPTELLLEDHLQELELVPFVREYVFALPRRWRFDYAVPDLHMAIEIEGGAWIAGRHTRGKGFEADCEKYSRAAALGWLVFRFTPGMIQRGKSKEILCMRIAS